MRFLLSVVGLCLYCSFVTAARSQSLDPSFNPGSGPNGVVHAILPLDDGDILVGGDFSLWNGEPRGSVVRLNPDGGIDPAFRGDVNFDVRQLFALQGGIIVVGVNSIVRLLADGSRDTNFQSLIVTGPVAATEDFLYTVFVPARPRVVIELRAPTTGALLTNVFIGSVGDRADRLVPFPGNRVVFLGQLPFATIALFGPSGLDTSFQGPPALHALNVAVAPDSSLYAALKFDNATPDFFLYHLAPSGALDTNFASVGAPASEFENLAVQPDGRLLYGAQTVKRVNLDGSLDTTFNPGFMNSTIHAIAVQPDGKILVGGDLGTLNGQAVPNIVRLLPDAVGPDLLTVSGRVTDGENGIPNVKVRIGGKNIAFTDANGSYTLIVPKPGNYVVHPSLPKTHFTPSSQRVRVEDDVILPDFVVRQRR
jgi:uncharacterized delta-60 repeat protein